MSFAADIKQTVRLGVAHEHIRSVRRALHKTAGHQLMLCMRIANLNFGFSRNRDDLDACLVSGQTNRLSSTYLH